MRILVVEDREELRVIFCAWLAAEGYEVTPAEDGEHAWRLLETSRFDLVVTDYQMPLMDGDELCRRIKTQLGPHQRLPVILISGEARVSVYADVILQKGTDGFRKDLSRAIAALLL